MRDFDIKAAAARLNRAWQEAGFRSKKEAAQAAGVPPNTFYGHLNGESKAGFFRHSGVYAKAFNISREELLGFPSEPASLQLALGPFDEATLNALAGHRMVITISLDTLTGAAQPEGIEIGARLRLVRDK